MKKIEFENAYSPVSELFHERIEETLLKIGKEEKMKHTKIAKAWILAAAFILVIGTAFAASDGFGLMDFLIRDESGVLPLENAANAIENQLLVYTDDLTVWTVDQAVYDGECVRALIKVAPANPETHAVSFPFMDDLPLTIAKWNIETEMSEKIPVSTGFPELEPAGDSQNVDIDRTLIQGVYLSENGEYSLYVLCPITLRDIDTAPETLRLWLYDGNDMKMEGAFTLNKCESRKANYLTSDAYLSDAVIKNVSLTQTPFASYLEIVYVYQRSGPELTLQPETTYYATEFGRFLHTDPGCSGMQNAVKLNYEEAAALDKDYLCPVCAGGSAEAITDTTTGGQLDFSLSGISHPLFFGGCETAIENGFKKTYIFSASEAFPEEISLNLIKKGEFTGDSLTLSKIR